MKELKTVIGVAVIFVAFSLISIAIDEQYSSYFLGILTASFVLLVIGLSLLLTHKYERKNRRYNEIRHQVHVDELNKENEFEM